VHTHLAFRADDERSGGGVVALRALTDRERQLTGRTLVVQPPLECVEREALDRDLAAGDADDDARRARTDVRPGIVRPQRTRRIATRNHVRGTETSANVEGL